jgi:cold shock CspA family protein
MIALAISFRGLEHSDTIEALVRDQVRMLERFSSQDLQCRVVIEVPHRHHLHGASVQVGIELRIPNGEIVVHHEPSVHAELRRGETDVVTKEADVAAPFADPVFAVREAFRAVRRRLQDHVHRRQGTVKVHVLPPTARVARIFRDEGYGFLETPAGKEVYFHANSVHNRPFAQIFVGDRVRYVEEAGDQGPQATTVDVVSRRK